MKRFLFVSLLVFSFCTTNAYAANWYVRPSGGSGAGTSWTAAWNGLSGISWGSVACGDTIWVAGGSYSQTLTVQKTCTSGSRLSIRRARSDASECTGALGWDSGYDATVAQTGAGLSASSSSSYFIISGRTSASGGSSGWTVTNTSIGARPISFTGGVNNLLVEYIDVFGGVNTATSSSSGDSRGFNVAQGSYHTFSHCNFRGFCAGGYVNSTQYFTFEYGSIYDITPSDVGPNCHPNSIYTVGASNAVVRYVKFYHNDGEGILWNSSSSNWQVYGNLFYNIKVGYSKALEISSNSTIANLKIFNNTFYNNWSDFQIDSGSSCGSGREYRNNLHYSSNGASSSSCGTQSNNLTVSSNPFVNLSGNDYHIISTIGANYPRNAGYDVSPYFTKDMDGNTFGADGAWDVGAYEYGSTVTLLKPSPPHLY
jgi:hypothetical protein